MDHTLNEVYSTRSMKRRYEVWFLRLGLADGSEHGGSDIS